ncbi:hypothetical protein [Paraconexibacter sp. AEG42_29]
MNRRHRIAADRAAEDATRFAPVHDRATREVTRRVAVPLRARGIIGS